MLTESEIRGLLQALEDLQQYGIGDLNREIATLRYILQEAPK